MADDHLISFYLDRSLDSKAASYDFLAQQMTDFGLDYEETLAALADRERIGSIQIADQVVLPHLAHTGTWQGIVIVRTKDPIASWSEQIKNIRLMVFLVIAKAGDLQERAAIQGVVKKLAKDDVLADLLTEKDERKLLTTLLKGD